MQQNDLAAPKTDSQARIFNQKNKQNFVGPHFNPYKGIVVPYLSEIDPTATFIPTCTTIELPLPLELYGRTAHSQDYFLEIIGRQHYLRHRSIQDFCRSLLIETFFVDKKDAEKCGLKLDDHFDVNAVFLREGNKNDYLVGVSNNLKNDFFYFIDAFKSKMNFRELPSIVQLLFKKSVALDDVSGITLSALRDPNASVLFRNRVVWSPELLGKYFEDKKKAGFFSNDIDYRMAQANREKDGFQLTDDEYFLKYGIER